MVVRLPVSPLCQTAVAELNSQTQRQFEASERCRREESRTYFSASFLIGFACFRDTGGQKAAGVARASSMVKINDKLEFNSCEYLTYMRSISRMV